MLVARKVPWCPGLGGPFAVVMHHRGQLEGKALFIETGDQRLGGLVDVVGEQEPASGLALHVTFEVLPHDAASGDSRWGHEDGEDPRGHGVETDGDRLFAHRLGSGGCHRELGQALAQPSLIHHRDADIQDPGVVDAAAEMKNRRNAQRLAHLSEAGSGACQRLARVHQAGLCRGDGAAAGVHHQHVLGDHAVGELEVMSVLDDLWGVAADQPHHAADPSGGDGVVERAVARAEATPHVVGQVLVGEAGHQIHALLGDLDRGRIAIGEALHRAPDDLSACLEWVGVVELDVLGPGDVRDLRGRHDLGVMAASQLR